jgi:transcription elongation factor
MNNATPHNLNEERNTQFDAQVVSTAIARLRALLASRDGDAVEVFHGLENTLTGLVDNQRLEALRAAISEFNFKGAVLKLDEIAERYRTNWDQAE